MDILAAMKILYGVVGEGMGHAMRSRVVLEHLVDQGHEIEIMASGRACDFLKKRFGEANRIHGFHIIFEENRVRRGKTLWSNVLTGLAGTPKNIQAYFDLIKDFRPDLVISDFESWTYLYAKMERLPIISIDNMQLVNRCVHPPEVIAGHEASFHLARAFIKGKLPFCDYYLITSFFELPPRKPSTFVFPPILRPEILAAKPRRGEHLLVYQSTGENSALEELLSRCGLECRVYGMRPGISEEQVEGNLRHRPFSESSFIEDLASARGVVAGAGSTLMGEAVHLRKPMLAAPIKHHFEQWLNARYLEYFGYGRSAENLEDPTALTTFINAIPACEEVLAKRAQSGNDALLAKLDSLLVELAGERGA